MQGKTQQACHHWLQSYIVRIMKRVCLSYPRMTVQIQDPMCYIFPLGKFSTVFLKWWVIECQETARLEFICFCFQSEIKTKATATSCRVQQNRYVGLCMFCQLQTFFVPCQRCFLLVECPLWDSFWLFSGTSTYYHHVWILKDSCLKPNWSVSHLDFTVGALA